MNFNEYQEFTRTTAIYKETCPTYKEQLSYTALGLAGEAGEVAEKIKKYLRDGKLNTTDVLAELGDVQYYLAQCADVLGYSLEEVASMNKEKLYRRMMNSTLQGSGDHR